jgi:hypothetical protein
MNNQPQNIQPIYVIQQQAPESEGAGNIALWLEIIFGWFMLLGVGHVYGGRKIIGIIIMIIWWIYIVFAALISSMTAGICACLFIPIYIAVPIFSGIQAKTYIKKIQGKGSWSSVGIVAGLGCVFIVIVSVIGVILFGGLLTGLILQLQNIELTITPYAP